MEYKNLTEASLMTVVNLVNEVFKDYIIPVHWTIQSFEKDIVENSISLENSFVVYENNEPIGFSIVSVRGERGRIDSIGLLKKYRGTGISSEILTRTMETLKWKGIRDVVLEVEDSEKRAIKFYQKHNFKLKRKLESLMYDIKKTEEPEYKYLPEDGKWVHDMAVSALNNLHRKPNWQREPKTLGLSEGRYIVEKIVSKGFTIGYIVWGTNEDNAFIVDISPIVDETKFYDLFKDALKRLSAEKNKVIMVSVPEDDPLSKVAKELDFKPFLTQWEMEKKIH